MPIDGAVRWNASVRSVSRWLALGSVAVAVLAYIGQVAAVPSLSSVLDRWASMSIVTSVCLVLLGSVLIIRPRGRVCGSLLLAAATLAGLTLSSDAFYGYDLVSPVLAHWIGSPKMVPAYMSTATGLGLVLISAAMLRLPTRQRNAFAGLAFLIGLTAVLGYAYGPDDLGTLVPFRTMSLNAAISIVALAVATILSDPEHGWGQVIANPERSGRVTRRQLLYAFVPAVVGLFLVQAIRHHILPTTAAMALLVVFTAVPLLWLVLRDGSTLAELDAERADRLSLVQQHRDDLQRQLDAQAEALSESNAKLLAIAEAASQSSEIRYRQLFDSIDAGFCVIDVRFAENGAADDYRFAEVNAAFERQTGLTGAAGKWMRELAPEHRRHWFDVYGQVARTGVPIRTESPAQELGGHWFDVFAFRISSHENLVGILLNDITARRTAELALQAVNETLEQRVEAAVAEREVAQEALRQSQKMEAIGQLTGGVAHDFNNLLTPILGSLDLLTRRSGFGPREQRLIAGALQSAERAKILVQRLLAFARRQPLQPGPVDVGALVANMAELVASTSGPQIRVSVATDPDLPPAIGDANQLEMAILNLCVNARDAMPDGGQLSLSVNASERPQQLDLPNGAYICLSVVDDGVGMDPETAGRAIEPFFSTKGIGKGTGLGLSMVHGLALQLGGAMTISSQIGRGTRIDFYLRAGDPVTIVPPRPVLPVAAPTPGRVLVVDDQEQVRLTTAHLLQELGFTTEECESGVEAERRLLAGQDFDLVVTDHLMPGLTGTELAARLALSRPKIAVLVISGYSDFETIAPGLNFLLKPFRKDDLAVAVERVCRANPAIPPIDRSIPVLN